jgi:hypothetical protein
MSIVRLVSDDAKDNKYHKSTFQSFITALKADIFALGAVFAFILSAKFMLILFYSWFGGKLYYPSLANTTEGLRARNYYLDSDGDGLPDVIEQSPKGVPVYDEDGNLMGWGTGTDPYNADSDRNLFNDGIEDILGTNPNSWIEPGYVWIILGLMIAFIIYKKFIYKPNRIKVYIKNEMNISGGVSKNDAKFAYKQVNSRKINTKKSYSPNQIHDFRKSLSGKYFEVDEETAYSYANFKKETHYKHFYFAFLFSMALILWGYLDIHGIEINSRYAITKIERLLNGLIKIALGLVLFLFSINSYLKYKKSIYRSKDFMEDFRSKSLDPSTEINRVK